MINTQESPMNPCTGVPDGVIRYLISRGSGSEDEIFREVAPCEAENGSRALDADQQQERDDGKGGSHVYPESSLPIRQFD